MFFSSSKVENDGDGAGRSSLRSIGQHRWQIAAGYLLTGEEKLAEIQPRFPKRFRCTGSAWAMEADGARWNLSPGWKDCPWTTRHFRIRSTPTRRRIPRRKPPPGVVGVNWYLNSNLKLEP